MMRYDLDLELNSAAAARGERMVTEPLSLRLQPGDALTLRGPNGSGKTSLLRAIAGVGRLSEGAVRVGTATDAAERARLSHLIGHRPGARGALSARETLHFHRIVLDGRGSVDGALERVGLLGDAERKAGAMSAGQLRRLALARLLVAERALWLLDEPTAALDTDGAAMVEELVAEHRAAGGVVLIATHDGYAPADAALARLAA